MAMNFGKNNRSVAFDPTSAFPLDARSYFESYELAVAAAAIAEEAGSSNTVYYYGQTIAVVENSKATLYIIQPNKTLTPIGGSVESSTIDIDTNQFEFKDGKLSLLGFNSGAAGQMLIKSDDNKLAWATPIETYTKGEIDSKIAAAGHLKRKILEKKEDIKVDAVDADAYIYMVKTGLREDDNKYNEYIVINGEIEPVGSWEVNLDDYAKKTDLEYFVLQSDTRLLTTADREKINNINTKAEENYIKSVSADFQVVDNDVDNPRKLILNNLSQDKIIGLKAALESLSSSKVDKTDANILLSTVDRQKLDTLTRSSENDPFTFSGQISADNVTGLADKINNLSQIKGIASDGQLSINKGILSIGTIASSSVAGLSAYQENVATELNKYANRMTTIENSITWQKLK